ncbi:hypothetical protein EMCG_08744 [[Emmonsia] crescens]|uniref:Uncharacterized protein n=1 Tax=[Emmonsia] crescens TaxID=73230 RepID=A0A0G2I5B7_9EURO|nr:hypothetical protein EMCG_08744 [Emmonsia crescens UAMH 3008]
MFTVGYTSTQRRALGLGYFTFYLTGRRPKRTYPLEFGRKERRCLHPSADEDLLYNDCLGWIDKIMEPRRSTISSIQQMINRNVRLHFATRDIRDVMAKEAHVWSHRFGKNASSVIVQNYDVIAPRFPPHDLFQNSEFPNPVPSGGSLKQLHLLSACIKS